jgi:hypothetical protein
MSVPVPGACLVPRRPGGAERRRGSPGKQDIVEFLPQGYIRRLWESCQTRLHFTHWIAALPWEPFIRQKVFLETHAKIKEATNSENNFPHVRFEALKAVIVMMISVYLDVMLYSLVHSYSSFGTYLPKCTTSHPRIQYIHDVDFHIHIPIYVMRVTQTTN